MTRREKILITGGAGMIGSNLVRELTSQGIHVQVVDDLSRGRLDYLFAEGRPVIDLENDFHLLDLTQAGVLDPLLEGVSYVYHLADVVAGIGYVFDHQGSLFRRNILINSNVVDSAGRFSQSLKGFIYVGTACSFPAHKQSRRYGLALREEDQYPAAPESAYGWSKLMGEYESLLLEKEHGIPVAVLSLHNVYGVPCDFGTRRSQVLPALIRKAIRYPSEDFVVWGSGRQGRAFVHVGDAVAALIAARSSGLGHGVIQIGPAVCTSIREISETVVEVSGKDIPIHYDTTRPEGDEWRFADYSKAQRLLGWSPRITLRDGTADLYRWIETRIKKTEHSETSMSSPEIPDDD